MAGDRAPDLSGATLKGKRFLVDVASPELEFAMDIPLAPGDRVRVRTTGGGGYGDPFTRPRTHAPDTLGCHRQRFHKAGIAG